MKEMDYTTEAHGGKARTTQQTKKDPFLVYKLGKQLCIVAVWFVIGFYVEIVGPTVPDIKQTLGFTYEQISRGLVGKSAGFFFGSLLGGLLHERFYRHTDLVMAIGLVLGSVGTFFIPWSNVLAIFFLMFMLTGISEGFLNTGGNTMVMHLWGEKAPGPMHSIHAGFGIGSLIVPQIVRPFLLDDVDSSLTTVTMAPNTTVPPAVEITDIPLDGFTANTSAPPVYNSQLWYPYAISSVCVMLVALIWFALYFVGPPKGFPQRNPSKSIRKLMSPATCAPGHSSYASILLVCLFLYFFQACGGERAFGKFIFTYAVEADVSFSKAQAATLNSVFWGSHALGRFLGIFIAHVIRPQIIISTYLVVIIITVICLKIFTYDSATALWILTSMVGLFSTIFFPSGMAWANIYLQMNSMATMVLLMGAAAGAMIYQYMPGFLFDLYGFHTFGYIMIVYALGLLVIYIIMQVIGSMHVARYTGIDTDISVNNGEDIDSNTDYDEDMSEKVHLSRTSVV